MLVAVSYSIHPSITKYDKLRSPTAVAAEATAIDQAVRRVLRDTLTQTNGTLRALFQIKLFWFLSHSHSKSICHCCYCVK
jgi:hypothetical protein